MPARTALLSTSAILAATLVLFIFVPLVTTPGGTFSVCGPSQYCGKVTQYESLSYELGGWGAVLQTGVNQYNVYGWVCMCPAEYPGQSFHCCVPPFAWLIWPAVEAVALGALGTFVFAIWLGRSSSRDSDASGAKSAAVVQKTSSVLPTTRCPKAAPDTPSARSSCTAASSRRGAACR